MNDDERLDSELAAAGAALRRDAAPVDGYRVMTEALHRRVARSRRNSVIAVGVAAAMLAALVGFRVNDSDRAEIAAGRSGVMSAEPGTPEAIVAKLPAAPVDPHDVKLVSTVSRFDSCDALLQSLRTVGASHVGSSGFGEPGYQMMAPAAADNLSVQGAPIPMPPPPSAGETVDTNVIVDGVDEPDAVKVTGSLIVQIWGYYLRVVDTRVPGVVGSVRLVKQADPTDPVSVDGGMPSSLLVVGHRAVVFGGETQTSAPVKGDPSAVRPTVQYMTITFVDLSDASAPKVVDRVRLEGQLVAARRVGNQVRIVTSSSMKDLAMVAPTTPNSVTPALKQNRLAVAGSSVDDWIPAWDHGRSTDAKPLMGCNRVVVPDTFAGVQMTSLVAFDIDGPFAPSATGILAPSEDITATADDVVVASHVWVDPAEQSGHFADWSTALHRFGFGADGPSYVASGQVTGSIFDDFSLAVLNDGTVAAVTVDLVPWDLEGRTKVTVRTLSTDSVRHRLTEVGSIVPKNPGVSDPGVVDPGPRFIGDRAVVSSGPRGSVLSVIDLSDPAVPKDLGSVTIAATGSYIHPLPGNRVLVVGQAPRPNPIGGNTILYDTAVSLVDIAAAPRLLAESRVVDAQVEVGFDHHAFTWWPSRSIAAFGATYASGDAGPVPPPPTAEFFTIGPESIVDRSVTPRDPILGPRCTKDDPLDSRCDRSGPPEVKRILVVEGQPWLFTNESAEHLDPDTYASLAVVPLPFL